ncbi:hypothetical protein GCM10025792_06740 [Pseudonocardia tropica]
MIIGHRLRRGSARPGGASATARWTHRNSALSRTGFLIGTALAARLVGDERRTPGDTRSGRRPAAYPGASEKAHSRQIVVNADTRFDREQLFAPPR